MKNAKASRRGKKTRFYISIDDEYCEYVYPVRLSDELSIDKVAETICSALRVRKPKDPIQRKPHYSRAGEMA